MVSCRYAKIQDVITQENICKHFTVKFSTLSNKKASDKTSKSVRDVFEADVVCYEKTISTSFTIIKRKRLKLMLTPKETVQLQSWICFVIRKISVKLMRRSLSKWNKIDHLCLLQNFFTNRLMFWNYIGNSEKQVSHHLYRGHHMSSLSLVYL